MSFLHQHISKQLKVVMSERLRSSALTSLAINDGSGVIRTFSSIGRKVLDTASNFLQHVQDECRIRVDISTVPGALSYNGTFKKTGLVSVREMKDFETVHLITQFIGAIDDLLSGKQNEAPVPNLFV